MTAIALRQIDVFPDNAPVGASLVGAQGSGKCQRVFSTILGTSAVAFPQILGLYVPDGSRILDMTFWHGVFWRRIQTSKYDLIRSDLCPWPQVDLRADLRCTPFRDGSFDVVVLDPPWGNGSTSPRTVGGRSYNMTAVRTPAEIRALFLAGLSEAYRLLRRRGLLIMKCQNSVDGGRQHWYEIEVFNEAMRLGFRGEDRFIMVPPAEPMIRHPDRPQRHSRKWGSTFWVFRALRGRRTRQRPACLLSSGRGEPT